MASHRKEPEPEPEPCDETLEEAASNLKSLREQKVEPLTDAQKGAVKLVEQQLRQASKKPRHR